MAEGAGDSMEEDMGEDQAQEGIVIEDSGSEADSPAGGSALPGRGLPKASARSGNPTLGEFEVGSTCGAKKI